MQLYNIGGEGQFYLGAIAGVGVALYLGDLGVDSTFVSRRRDVPRGRARRRGLGRDPGRAPRLREDERDHHLADAQLRRGARPHVPDHRQPLVLAGPRSLRGPDVPARQDASPRRRSGRAATLDALGGILVVRSGSASRSRSRRVMWVVYWRTQVRLRGAGDRRLAARGPLRGHAPAPQDPRGHVHLRRDRRARRRQLRGRLRLPDRPDRAADVVLRLHGDRRRGARPLQPARGRARRRSSSAGSRTRATRSRAPTSPPGSSA